MRAALSDLQIRVLGPVEVERNGVACALGGPKQRALLSALALASGPIPAWRLVRGLWHEPPATAANAVAVYVSRLRRCVPIAHGPGGYRLAAPAGSTDLERVRHVLSARPWDPDELRSALDSWRGEPLEEFTAEPFAEAGRTALAELRLSLTLAWIDCELQAGREDHVIGDLRGLVAAHPYHEGAWERLVVALYRSGRQADALDAVHHVTHLLRSELGVDPVPRLQAIREQILTHDRALAASREAMQGDGTGTRPRAAELDALKYALDASTSDGKARMVTVLGEGGMGKSHLVETAFRHLGRRRVAFAVERDRLAVGLGVLTQLLAEPEEAARTRSLSGLRQAVQRRLDQLASQGTVVVVVDDLHWAGDVVLDYLEELTDRVSGPVLLVVCARPELLDRRPEWSARVSRSEVLRLRPLGDAAAEALLDEEAATLARPVSGQARRAVVRASGGSPLLLVEGLSAYGGPGERRSLALGVAVRLGQISTEARALARCASALGSGFPADLLVHVSAGEIRGDIGELLEELVDAGVLARDPAVGLRFRHELIRASSYGELSPEAARELHRRVVIAAVDPAAVGAVAVGVDDLAHHVAASALHTRDGLPALALERLWGHARQALARGDAHGANAPYDVIVAALSGSGPPRALALTELGSALVDAGSLPKAHAVLDEAVAAAQEAGQRWLLARAEVERDWLRVDAAPTADSLDRIALRTRNAVVVLHRRPDAEGETRARLLLAVVHNLRGRRSAQVAQAERVLGTSPRPSHRNLSTAISLVSGGMVEGSSPADRTLARTTELLDLAPGEPLVQAAVSSARAEALALMGDFAGARRTVADARDLATSLGLDWTLGMVLVRSANIERQAGRPANAERDLRAAERIYQRLGEGAHRSVVTAYLADIVGGLGREGEANDLVMASRALGAPDDVVAQILWRVAAARTALSAGRADDAVELAEDAVEISDRTDLSVIRGDALLLLAAAYTAVGRSPKTARARARRILRGKGGHGLVLRMASGWPR